jgi:hypothetical protein
MVILPRRAVVPCVAVLAWIGAPAMALAQSPAQERTTTKHPFVYVIDSVGIETAGRLLRVGPTSFSIETATGVTSFDWTAVSEVYRKGDSVWSGFRSGAVIGAGFGLVVARNVSCGPLLGPAEPCNAQESLAIAGMMGGVGAGVGVLIDALIHGRTPIDPRRDERLWSSVYVVPNAGGARVLMSKRW